MITIFDVYVHPQRGQWGTSVQPGQALSAEIKEDGILKLERIDPIRFSAELSKRIRMGYTKIAKPKYLHQFKNDSNQSCGLFSETHPDLKVMGHSLIMFATKPHSLDLPALLAVWEERLQSVTGVIDLGPKWLDHIRDSGQYLTAFTDHPAMSLLLAQWAIENRSILLTTEREPPVESPSQKPLLWKKFLMHWFEEKKIQTALNQLGWSLSELLNSKFEIPQISSASPDVDGWNSASQMAAF